MEVVLWPTSALASPPGWHAPPGRWQSTQGAQAAWPCCRWLGGSGTRSGLCRWSSCASDSWLQVPSSASGPSDGLGEGGAYGAQYQADVVSSSRCPQGEKTPRGGETLGFDYGSGRYERKCGVGRGAVGGMEWRMGEMEWRVGAVRSSSESSSFCRRPAPSQGRAPCGEAQSAEGGVQYGSRHPSAAATAAVAASATAADLAAAGAAETGSSLTAVAAAASAAVTS